MTKKKIRRLAWWIAVFSDSESGIFPLRTLWTSIKWTNACNLTESHFCTLNINNLYSIFLTADKQANTACKFLQILSAECNDVKSCQGALHIKENVNMFCNVLHHHHLQKAVHLYSLKRARLCITEKGAGLMTLIGNPKAEPFLALEPQQAVESPFWEVFKVMPRQNLIFPATVILISTRGWRRRTPRGLFPSTFS